MKLPQLALALVLAKSAAWTRIAGSEELDTILRDNERTLIAYVLPNDTKSQVFEQEWSSLLDGEADEKLNATAFQAIDDVVFIGRFGPDHEHLRSQFDQAARTYHDRFSFAVAEARQGQEPTLACYNNLDGEHKSTAEFASPRAIPAFVKLCSAPLIPELMRSNELSFYESRKSIVHYFVHNEKEREAYVAEMRPLAKKLREYLHFVTTDANEYADAAEMMGLRRGAGGLSVQNPNTGDVYPYARREKITAATVEAFLGDIVQGKVQPWRGDAGHDEL
ncbi:8c46e751-5e39-4daf-9b2b-69cab3de846a [Thermothielavioides terrestris]|uniref:8c46e751-5e39-4daf-9b2b-69cab3de846a n=1 Tax=Thermothielavioides terrestris TaxID=2587410 RepID=A0A3S4F4D2_9PEZI|nr:8c46e751-5e39-4daf-9b2b-69cab3de846a [Thermothielavioides terrestris]